MSDSPLPEYVDTRKIFQQHAVITGTVALARLDRFRGLLASDAGSVRVELEFFDDESGQHIISGKLRAEVEVLCQRCLEPIGIVLHDDIKLALLKDESKSAMLNPELDPWICADTKLELASMVEEQLMLCMPIVSFHESAHCNSALGQSNSGMLVDDDNVAASENPFAVLKSLQTKDRTN